MSQAQLDGLKYRIIWPELGRYEDFHGLMAISRKFDVNINSVKAYSKTTTPMATGPLIGCRIVKIQNDVDVLTAQFQARHALNEFYELRSIARDLIDQFPRSYEKEVRIRLYDLYLELSRSGLPFKETMYLFLHGETEFDHGCPVCGSKPTFVSVNIGYLTFCSIACHNHELNTSLGEIESPTLPVSEEVLMAIGTKFTGIPWILRNHFPILFKFLDSNGEDQSISEKLYRWIHGDTNECRECGLPTKFYDFGRGFYQFCGIPCMARSQETKDKKEETLIEKTGMPYPMQNPSSKAKQRKSAFSSKLHELPSGRIVIVQGYEGKVIDHLLKGGLKETDLILEEERIPKLVWIDDFGKEHRYYPDIFIPNWNLLIEVKSKYTWNGYGSTRKKTNLTGPQINFRKRQAALDAGFNFRFMIR